MSLPEGAIDIAAAVRSGGLPAVDVCLAAIERFRTLDPALNAVLHLAENAIARAAELRPRAAGQHPLLGFPLR